MKITSKPRITHIITTLDVGGAERALFNLLSNGLNERFDNSIITLKGVGYYGKSLKEMGFNVQNLDLDFNVNTLTKLKYLLNIVKSNRPAILQGWMYHGNVATYLVTTFNNRDIPSLWNIRDSLDDLASIKLSTKLTIKLNKYLSGHPDSIIFNSKRSLEQHKNFGFKGKRYDLIYNGFVVPESRGRNIEKLEARNKLDLTTESPVIGLVSRGAKQKDIPTLIDAFNQAKTVINDLKLICVGRNIPDYIPKSMPTEGILFLGERSDVGEIIPAFDILCLSSVSEGFPNVIGEAMLNGVMCIGTDVGDVREIIGNTGICVEPKNSKKFANALIEAFTKGSGYIQEQGLLSRERVKKEYDMYSSVIKYENLYTELIK